MQFTIYKESSPLALELNILYTRFIAEAKKIDSTFARTFVGKLDKHAQKNILICMPYWITDTMECRYPLNVIRALSLGNFVAAHIIFITISKII